MKRPREQDTVTAVLAYLRLRGIPAWRMNTGAFRGEYKGKPRFHRFGVVGMSDIIGVLPFWPADSRTLSGVFLAIEIKGARGVLRPAQRAFLNQVTKAGGTAFVARTLDDVRQELGL